MLHVHNFSYGLLTPALAYVMSCLGAFLGLRCTSRARAHVGVGRASWLALAAVSIGVTGIWVMHFIAMLGFTIPGETIRYNVPETMVSAGIAVIVVGVGLFIVGFGGDGLRPLLIGGLITGIGVASMHYTGMEGMRMPSMVRYSTFLVVVSVIIAVVAATAALWAGLHIRGLWSTLGASLIMGVAVSGMHYTGMAAMRVYSSSSMAGMISGATAGGFLLPLILGISIFTFILTLTIALAPSEDEIRADAALMERIAQHGQETAPPPAANGHSPRASRRPVRPDDPEHKGWSAWTRHLLPPEVAACSPEAAADLSGAVRGRWTGPWPGIRHRWDAGDRLSRRRAGAAADRPGHARPGRNRGRRRRRGWSGSTR
jgi:NO-binding membrane sensor protein with MHYT domain